MNKIFDRTCDIAWCPGCGDFGLRTIMMEALEEAGLTQQKVCFVSGIGQAAKAPQYYDTSYFNGLHGRALPAACGIAIANPGLKVIVESGDGDMYGEGGNHFLHTIRRNPDITLVVHDNMVYGLTKGQASPTTRKGMKTPIQTEGVHSEPLNPIALAITAGATYVARGSVGERDLTRKLIVDGLNHKGLALIDVFQSCVSFNKLNTHQWFKEHSALISEGHDVSDRLQALALAFEEEPWRLGLFYRIEGRPTFEDAQSVYEESREPLFSRRRDQTVISELMAQKR